MITIKHGNLFDSEVESLVNLVNCAGVMGAGLARAFAIKYPDMEKDYIEYCDEGHLKPGGCFVWYSRDSKKIIINAATKDGKHYDKSLGPSKIFWVQSCIDDIADITIKLKLNSIAIPPLGCGLGGLDESKVWPYIYKTYTFGPKSKELAKCNIEYYAQSSTIEVLKWIGLCTNS